MGKGSLVALLAGTLALAPPVSAQTASMTHTIVLSVSVPYINKCQSQTITLDALDSVVVTPNYFIFTDKRTRSAYAAMPRTSAVVDTISQHPVYSGNLQSFNEQFKTYIRSIGLTPEPFKPACTNWQEP